MQISLKTRFVISTLLTQLPLVVVSMVVVLYASYFTRHFDEAVNEVTTELEPVHEVQRDLTAVSMVLHDYLIEQAPQELDTYKRYETKIDRTFALFNRKSTFNSPTETRLFDEAHDEWTALRTSIDDVIQRADRDSAQDNYARMKRFDAQLQVIFRLLDEAEQIARDELLEARAEVLGFRHRIMFNMGGLLLFGIVLGTASAIYLSRSILVPVQNLIEGTRRLSAKDLDYRIPVTTADEFGELSTAFNAMAERLDRTYKVLHEMATRDDLTLLLNAREFHRRLEIEISRSDRYRHPLSLIFIDVDHFKNVNDTFGHQIGDEVLRAVARILSQRVRPTDHVARYGGEEFAVICPETGLQDAKVVAERIRVAFHDSVVYHSPQGPLSVSISLGVSCFPESSESEHNLLRDADKALYQAKNDGRNCTRIFKDTPSS